MKLIDRHEFANDRRFETYPLEPADIARYNVPECDVIGLRRVSEADDRMTVLRPDEALIQARMLVEAVRKVSKSYEIDGSASHGDSWQLANAVADSVYGGDADGNDVNCPLSKSSNPLATELVEDLGGS